MTWSPERYLAFGDHRTRPAVDLLARVAAVERRRGSRIWAAGPATRPRCWWRAGRRRRSWASTARPRCWPRPARAGCARAGSRPTSPAGRRPPLRSLYSQRRPAMAAGPRGAAAAPARRAPAGRRAGGPDAAQLRGALACAAARGRRDGALGRAPAPVAAGRAGRRARLVLRSAGAARGRPRHLGDRVSAGAGGRGPGAGLDPATALRPVQAALDQDELRAFEADYRQRLRDAYPRRPDGRTLFPFRRLFIVACRSG